MGEWVAFSSIMSNVLHAIIMICAIGVLLIGLKRMWKLINVKL